MNRQGSQPGGDGEVRTGMRPWLKGLLALSLAANLAVAGLAIGAALRWRDGDHPGRRAPSVGSMIFRDLDRETRSELRRRAEGDHGSYFARRRAEGEAVISALLATPFDAAALSALLEKQAMARHGFQLSVQDAWVRQIRAMSDEERSDYARRMQNVLRRHADRKGAKPEQ